jgi:hypothetical protein
MTKNDAMIHRVVVSAVNGMTDYLTCERKRVPEEIVLKAQRMESLLFADTTHISRATSLRRSSGNRAARALCGVSAEAILR